MHASVKVEDAVGLILAHDITEIRPGEFKGRAFKKGHLLRPEDVDHLKRLGKNHIYTLALSPGQLHENEAAIIMADAFCGEGVVWEGEPKEGKIELRAKTSGLLKVDVAALTRINLLADVMCASRHTDTLVEEGSVVAATRAIPLVAAEAPVREAADIARSLGGILRVKPLRKPKAALIITGNEVYHHLIEDKFEAVLRRKITDFAGEVIRVAFAPDDAGIIEQEIRTAIADGADLILTSGGMSVDPDDVTRIGIGQVGGEVAFHGVPVLPGAMLMISYADGIPILGVPGGAAYFRITVLDLVLPRILAGEILTREDIARMGHGGLCLNCKKCTYPICPFGK